MSKLDSLTESRFSSENFWIRNIKQRNDEAEFEKPYLQKYYLLDSVSSTEVYKDMSELFETGQFDSLNVSINYDADSTELRLNYTLNPVINEVEILANVLDDGRTAEKIFHPLKGKPFNSKIIFNAIKKFISEYKKQGYILFNLDSYEFNDSTGKLILDFNPGVVSRININSETSRTVIEREFNIKPGERLRYSELEEGLQNLRATGLFDDISLTIEQNNEETFLNLNVHEEISSLLKLGFIVDNVYNAQLALDFRDVNLYGTGTELGLFLFGGAGNRAYILEHIAHRILNSYFTYKLNAYYKFNDVTVYNRVASSTNNTFNSFSVGKYRQAFYGTSLSIGTQLEKFGKLIFTGKYQVDEIKNKEGNTANTYKTKIVGLRISALVDNQNKYPYPDDGLYFSGYYETAQSFFGGNEGYIVFNGDLRYYLSVTPGHVISPRVQLGFGDKTLPLSEQFTLGGQPSFFGAHENEFRGRQIFLTSLMYQYRLPFKIFFDTFIMFRYDLGSTWDVQEQIRFKDLRHGIGGMLSFDTPIGPADFSIGRSFIINKGLKEDSFSWGEVLFYFSIGHAVSF
jgi:NTE family protein